MWIVAKLVTISKTVAQFFFVENSTFTGNVAHYGGAICITNSTYSEVSNCKFDRNSDAYSVRGIDFFKMPIVFKIIQNSEKIDSSFPHLKFRKNPSIKSNKAGGVLWATTANVTVTRCTFSQNYDGVIWSQNTTLRVQNSEFKNNSAIIYVMQIYFSNVTDIVNCTFKEFGFLIGVLQFVHSGYITISNSKFENSHDISHDISFQFLHTVILSYSNTYLLVDNSEFRNLTCINGYVLISVYSKTTKLKSCILESINFFPEGILFQFVFEVNVIVEDCRIAGNLARLIFSQSSQIAIRNAVILKNSYLSQSFFLLSVNSNSFTELTGCIFERNIFTSTLFFNASQQVILRDCKFINNNATDHVLIGASGKFCTIVNTDFINNTVSLGILFALGGAHLSNCTFYNNYADRYTPLFLL